MGSILRKKTAASARDSVWLADMAIQDLQDLKNDPHAFSREAITQSYQEAETAEAGQLRIIKPKDYLHFHVYRIFTIKAVFGLGFTLMTRGCIGTNLLTNGSNSMAYSSIFFAIIGGVGLTLTARPLSDKINSLTQIAHQRVARLYDARQALKHLAECEKIVWSEAEKQSATPPLSPLPQIQPREDVWGYQESAGSVQFLKSRHQP